MSVPASNVVPLEPKSLTDLLVIHDQLPADFYTNTAYDAQLDKAIEASSNLVYTLDDDGEKKAKSDATSINKFATMVDKFVAATYKEQTEAAAQWRDGKKLKIKLLRDNRQRLIDLHEEKRNEKLTLIRSILSDCLNELYDNDVKEEFRKGDIEPAVKLNALTPGGKLTAAAIRFCKALYDTDLAEQKRIEARHLLLENRCLRAEINPPLTQAHFGTVFYASDEIFNEKLEQLIEAEVSRKAEMEERIRKQTEAENQRKIDDALKAQQEQHEANFEQFKVDQEKMRQEQQEKAFPSFPSTGRVTAQQVNDELERMKDRRADIKNPPVDPVTHKPINQAPIAGKRTVNVTATFSADLIKPALSEKLQAILVESTFTATFAFAGISERISNQGVADFFKNQLPEELKSILVHAEGENA
jgi:hypothetical protein